jgi:peroxiredoxin
MPGTRFGWMVLTLLAALLGSFWIAHSRLEPAAAPETAGSVPAPVVGYAAPDFALPTLTGERVALADLGDRPIILNFWATWCGPCRVEMPALQATAERYAGLAHVIGINQGEPPERVAAFATEYGISYPLLLDSDNAIHKSYRVRSLPTTLIIDGNGVVRAVVHGAVSAAVLAEQLNRLLP